MTEYETAAMPTPEVYDRMCGERDKLQARIEALWSEVIDLKLTVKGCKDNIRSLRLALKPYADAHRLMEQRLCPYHAEQCDCDRYSFSKAELLEARFAYWRIGAE